MWTITKNASVRTVAAALTYLVLLAAPAHAGVFTAKVKSLLLYDRGNLVYVYPEGGVVGAPPCHGGNGNYLSFSMSRPMAKQYLAALLAAQLAGKNVEFTTTGTCGDQSVSETLDYFTVYQ